MRLFIAIPLSDPFRNHLARVQQALRPAVGTHGTNWTKPSNLHLTLKFLGEVPDERVTEVCDALGAIRSSGPVELLAENLLCFPPNGPIRIVGAGLRPTPPLQQLVEQIELACEPLGFPLEGRAFRPHITLARARKPLPGRLRRDLADAAIDLWPGPAMPADRFVLMESQLSSSGPAYTPAATFYINLP